MPREQEWKVIGGVYQRHFPYGGVLIEPGQWSEESLTEALLNEGEVSAFMSGGVWGVGRDGDGTFEGEFWRNMRRVDSFEGADLATAVNKAVEYAKLGEVMR